MYDQASLELNGCADTRGWVEILWNAVRDTHGNPTRAGPLRVRSSQSRAGPWKALPASTEYSSTFASTITSALHIIEQFEGLGDIGDVDA